MTDVDVKLLVNGMDASLPLLIRVVSTALLVQGKLSSIVFTTAQAQFKSGVGLQISSTDSKASPTTQDQCPGEPVFSVMAVTSI